MTQTKVEAQFVKNNRMFRNLIINGDMAIWQRSTSTVTISDGSNEGYNSVDRWKMMFGSLLVEQCSGQEAQMSQQERVLNTH